MDLGTIMIGLAFLLFCVIVFIILSRSNRKKEKKILQSLMELAEQRNCNIVQHDIWNNSAIGIDNTANIVFAVRETKKDSNSFQIDLSEIQKCRIINVNRMVGNKEDNYKIIEKLELGFAYRDKNKAETILNLYNAEHDDASLNGELQLIEKWCRIANDKLKILSLKK